MESVDTAAVAPPPLASTSAAAAAASVALPALPRWLQVKKAAEKREREYRYLKRCGEPTPAREEPTARARGC